VLLHIIFSTRFRKALLLVLAAENHGYHAQHLGREKKKIQ